MAGTRIDAIDNVFDDHPSLNASLQDFEHQDGGSSDANRSPRFNIPSHHSGFLSSDAGSDVPDSDSTGPWSPPAWRRHSAIGGGGSGWFKQQLMQRESREGSPLRPSRETSPQYESAPEGDVTIAANVRLPPDTPSRQPSGSPERDIFEESIAERNVGREASPVKDANNFIRFALRADIQHRTDPIDSLILTFRSILQRITSSKTSTTLSIIIAFASLFLLRLLFSPPPPTPVPDLVKLSHLAQSFEPLIYYSENGIRQISTLQETGIAVWDLGESVRSSNMTSAPIIVRELDELSDTLKTLATELTRFFANVDGDVDGILIVMEWAKRELGLLNSSPNSAPSIASAVDNVHAMLAKTGLLTHQSGAVTPLGRIVTECFGQSSQQRTRRTLQRTFDEFLAVLEDAIAAELSYSNSLFVLFERIDRQFLNLARTVIRESDQQEREEGDLLSSLWSTILGPDAGALRKFEKNKSLLSNIRAKTIDNKKILLDHNGKLLTLKANLEMLRRKLVSPLVRGRNGGSSNSGGEGAREAGSYLEVGEQVRGLGDVLERLRGVREGQKGRVMEVLYGAGANRGSGSGSNDIGLDGR